MRFFLSYLLMPIMAVVFGAIAFILAKRNKLLQNKKLIFYILLAGVLLALPSLLGFIQYWFMPYIYVPLMAVYLLLGWLNVLYIRKSMTNITKHYYIEFIFTFIVMFLGMALFSVVFNIVNELSYGIWASTCILPFIIPSLYYKTYQTYMTMPLEIYKVWRSNGRDVEASKAQLDITNLMVVDIELFKDVTEKDLLHITAKTSENIAFGTWFEIFLTDYNKKSSLSRIEYFNDKNTYGWIFYIKSSFFKRRKYIDPDLTIKENNIKAHDCIIARRAGEEITQTRVFNK